MAKKVDKAVVDLIIEGRSAETSVNQLGQALRKVTKELRDMKEADDPQRYRQLIEEKKKLLDVYKKQKETISDLRSGWEKFTANLGGITAGVVGGNLLSSALSKAGETVIRLVTRSGELSDGLAEVQKQTGLAGKDLKELNTALEQIDTRTPADELRKLAAVAGKLGYQTKEDVLAFVKVADMLSVTLAKDLGGSVEDAVNDVGKLIEIFGIKEEFGIEEGMLKTASAINTIGASSAANEGYLINFAKRFAGIAPNAGISIADTLGLAATFDVLGQSAELSSTNIAKIIVAIGKDMPYFAKVAGMQLQDFTNLMKTDANEGFIRVLEGAKSSSTGLQGMVKMLETLGIEGSEGAQILGALSKNTAMLREQQDISNKSFDEGTSILKEFNTANNTSGAVMEKIGNRLAQYFDKAAGYLDPLIIKFGELVGVVNKLDLALGEFGDTQARVMDMEKRLPGLIAKYEALREKTSRTKEEQKELTEVTRAIAEVVPEAAFEFDRYGNALQINTAFLTNYIRKNRELLEQMREQKKSLVGEEVDEMSKKAAKMQNDLNRGKTIKVVRVTSMEGIVKEDAKMNADEIKRMQGDLAALQLNIKARRQDMKELLGIGDIDARRRGRGYQAPGPTAPTGAPATTDRPEGGPSKGSSKDSEVKELERLQSELQKIRDKITMDALTGHQKEIQAAHQKYEALRDQAKGHKDILVELNELEAKEIAGIQAAGNDKQLSDFDKLMRAKLESMNDTEAQKTEFLTGVSNLEEERRNSELFNLKEHYQKLITQAEMLGLNTTGLYVLWAESYNLVKAQQAAKEIEDEHALNQTLTNQSKEKLNNELGMIQTKADAYKNVVQSISNIFGILAGDQAEYTDFQKAITVVQLAIDTAAAISSAVRVAASGSVTPIDLFVKIAATVAAVTGNILAAKKALSKANTPAPPKFAAGGFTNLSRLAEGYVDRSTLFDMPGRPFIAGEAGREFILSNAALQVPAVANFAAIMDGLQQTKNYAGMQSALQPKGDGAEMAVVTGLARMNAQLSGLRGDVVNSSRRPLTFSHDKFQESQDFMYKILDDTSV